MKTTLIPVELCDHVIRHKLAKPFQLYMLLKSISSGKLKIDDALHKVLADTLGRKSVKTIHKNLSILLQLNFIGHNPKTDYYFIRGYQSIQAQLNMKASSSAEFDYADIDNIQAFCMAAVIGYIVNQQRKRKWLSEREKGRSRQNNHLSSAYYVANWNDPS